MRTKGKIMIVDPVFDEIARPILFDEEYLTLRHYVAHSDFTVYDHSLLVAERSYLYAKGKGWDLNWKDLIRGALLHDYYLYDWHLSHKGHRFHGFRHPAWSLHNAMIRYRLTPKEKNIILSHMFPLTFYRFPHSREAWLVCHFDSLEAWHETFSRREDDQKLLKLAAAVDKN
jgi:uncharacterized protein